MNNQQKIDILTSSFETLKSNILNNTTDLYEISSIIEQMFLLDEESALLMWEYTLENYTHYSSWNHNATYFVAVYNLVAYRHNFGLKQLLSLLKVHPTIKQKVFSESYCLDYEFFVELIESNRLFEFEEYYSIIEQNENFLNDPDKDDSLGDMLEYISYSISSASSDAISLLLQKANVVSGKSKAIVNVNLLKLM